MDSDPKSGPIEVNIAEGGERVTWFEDKEEAFNKPWSHIEDVYPPPSEI